MSPSPRAIAEAIGKEIRRTRAALGWTRGDLVARMDSDCHVQTVAGYEQGNRHCTVARLVELCRAMDVDAAALFALALQRAELVDSNADLRVDLRRMVDVGEGELGALWRWATNRATENTDHEDVATVSRVSVPEMAACLGMTPNEVIRTLLRFTPELVRRSG